MVEHVEQQHQTVWRQVCPFLLLIAALFLQLLVPTNPDNTLPLIPECLSLVLMVLVSIFVFSKKQNLSILRHEKWMMGLIFIHHLFILTPRVLWALKNIPHQQWVPCTTLNPSTIRYECLFHSAYNHHYALRQWSSLSFALVFAALTFLMVRYYKQMQPTIFWSLTVVSALVSLAACAGYLGWQGSVLPRFLATNDSGILRATQVFANPSWTWPYLTTGLLASLFLVHSISHKHSRWLAVGLSFLICCGILMTQQRGGQTIVAFWLLYICFSLPKNKNIATKLVALAFFIVGLWVLKNPYMLFGESWRKFDSMISSERLHIWSAAFELFKEKPLLGHGYASWFALVSYLGQTKGFAEVFPTAHNLFIQMFVELGFVETMVICIIFLFIGRHLFLMYQTKKMKYFIVFSIAIFLFTVSVQEVDYIRPTLYAHSLFWAALAGQKPSNHEGSATSLRFSWNTRKKYIQAAGVTAIVVLLCTTAYVQMYWAGGAYAFEVSAAHAGTPIRRWLYKTASIPAYILKEFSYRIQPLRFFNESGHLIVKNSSDEIGLSVKKGENANLVIENRHASNFIPQRYDLTFDETFPDHTRTVSASLEYLWFDSNLAVYWSQGLLGWEKHDQTAGQRCEKECIFIASSCLNQGQLDFSIKRISVSEGRFPMKVALDYAAIPNAETSSSIEFSQKNVALLNNSNPSLTYDIPASDNQIVTLKGQENSKYFIVRLRSDTTVPDVEIKNQSDKHEISVFIGDVACQR